MKKIIALLLVAALGVILTACTVSADAETKPFGQADTTVAAAGTARKTETPSVTQKPETQTTEPETKEPTSVQETVTGKGTTVEGLKAYYGIDSTYRETVDADFNGYTTYYYAKADSNGVVNVYDALSIVVDNETQEIFTYKRFDRPAFIEPVITESEARAAAVNQYGQYGDIKDCQLEYYMPDYPDGEVYLSFTVTFSDEYAHKLYINAQNGAVLGTDELA